MKKTIIILITLCVLSLNVYALVEGVVSTRVDMGGFLNQSTRLLKVYFNKVQIQLEKDEEELKELKRKSEDFLKTSSSPEINPTILKQGRESLIPCDYKSHDLVWQENDWKCLPTSYDESCVPNDYEKQKEVGNDIKCVPVGRYDYVADGWGLCNPDTGIQKSKSKCMYIDGDNLPRYQVENSNCDGLPNVIESNCYGEWIAEDWEECIVKSCTAKTCLISKNLSGCWQSTGGGCSTSGALQTISDYEISRLPSFLRRKVPCAYQSYNCIDSKTYNQTRAVTCSEQYCDNSKMPELTKKCPITYGDWKTGSYTESSRGGAYTGGCSVSAVYEKRSVSCTTSLCNPSNMPSFFRGMGYKSCSGH